MDTRIRTAGLVAGGLVFGAALLVGGLRVAHAKEVVPGVRVDGVEVGGLSEQEAVLALEATVGARSQAPITLQFEGREFVVLPSEFAYEVDVTAAVERAMAVGRDAGVIANSWRHVTALWTEERLGATDSIDEPALVDVVARVAAEVDDDAGHGSLDVDVSTLTVSAVAPRRGLILNREDTSRRLLASARTDGPEVLQLDVAVAQPTVPMAVVEAAAARATEALRGPLRLFHDGVQVSLDPADVAAMLDLRPVGDDDVALGVDASAVERAFVDVVAALEEPAVNAVFDIPRAPPTTLDGKAGVTWEPLPMQDVRVRPSIPGATFDADLAAAQIGEMLDQGLNDQRVALREVSAEFTSEDAKGLGITHLLGTFTTYHSCCQSRVHNIQRLADMVDHTIVEPGEQFSINQISGDRTCTKGFRLAGMILRGEIVDSCGGGVSQFGTTTFNAAFFSGLQLDEWKAHSFYISRYPMGREATLNYPSPDIDVKFTNDTGHGLLVRTAHTPTSITVSIYGQSDVAKVEATRSGTYNPRTYTTERRPNPALAPGQEVRVQSGQGGFSVRVNRIVTKKDGTVVEREIVTVYVPEREIIEYGPGQPAPAPSSSPSPAPSSSPSTAPSSSPSPSPSPSPAPSGEPEPEPTPSPTPLPTGR